MRLLCTIMESVLLVGSKAKTQYTRLRPTRIRLLTNSPEGGVGSFRAMFQTRRRARFKQSVPSVTEGEMRVRDG